ncbi:MAG: DivIVA domain-containing protein [Calditrichaeota bacterium]|nr:MAG: DivIVA domain-containing protein [Calditrichota bacterium]
MKLTPIEIKNQEFKKSMRGYDPVEVDTFLELVAEKYQELLDENQKLSKQNLIYETELNNYRDVEKTLKATLKNVQENSQIAKENSQKEAGLIKKEAELAAAQMLEKTRLQVLKMREELVNLTNQKQSFINRLKHVLTSQMELLEILESDDLDVRKLKARAKAPAAKNTPSATPAARPKATPAVKKAEQKPEKTHGKDLFNDIFGDTMDSDEFAK